MMIPPVLLSFAVTVLNGFRTQVQASQTKRAVLLSNTAIIYDDAIIARLHRGRRLHFRSSGIISGGFFSKYLVSSLATGVFYIIRIRC